MQIVRCDRLGRIVIDKTMRKNMGNTFAIVKDQDRIILMAMQKSVKKERRAEDRRLAKKLYRE